MKYSDNNKPYVCYLTDSSCFKGSKSQKVVGILWHSTGADNPNLKRYVQPSDDSVNRDYDLKLLGVNKAKNDWNHIVIRSGVNAFIGKFADGSVGTVQTLPWDMKPWGCGSGTKGSCNNGWIQFEICEDNMLDRQYFEKVYQEAVELTAYLCVLFGLNPKGTVRYNGISIPVITCHADAHALGFASNHADVNHWFKRYGKTMETVRNDVHTLVNSKLNQDPTYKTTLQSGNAVKGAQEAVKGTQVSQSDNSRLIWDYLLGKFKGNKYAVAGIMGNLYAESGLRPDNLQNSYNSKFGVTDEQYTWMVDDGSYTFFVNDKAGYGLAQWTFWSRKKKLLNYAQSHGKSIGDLEMQLDFFMEEMKSNYIGVFNTLYNCRDVVTASNTMLLQYERPADQSDTVKAKRLEYSMTFFNKFASDDQNEDKGQQSGSPESMQVFGTGSVTEAVEYATGTYITVSGPMRLRMGPGKSYPQAAFASMTPSAKTQNREYAYTGLAYYKAGLKFTAKEIMKDMSGGVWAKTPSGWICITDGSKQFCRKV